VGRQYPINTWDEPGSDPDHPGNSRFTINWSNITSGPAMDPAHEGDRFLSVQNQHGKSSYIVGDEYEESSGGCFIATASIKGDIPVDALTPLKTWRYNVMETSLLGQKLSTHYRRTAPDVARKIGNMPRVAAFLRICFVIPAIVIAQKPKSYLRDSALWAIFILGSLTARAIAKLKSH
jgi:hypothetical protein